MKKIDCLHGLIDHLARNGAVIVLSPFNVAELDPSVDVGKLQIVDWPVKTFTFGSDTVSATGWKSVGAPVQSSGEALDPKQ